MQEAGGTKFSFSYKNMLQYFQGTEWVKIDGKLSQIDVFDDEVVGTNSAMNIYRTPYEAPSAPVMAGTRVSAIRFYKSLSLIISLT